MLVVLRLWVLVSRLLEDKESGLGLGIGEKVWILTLVLLKQVLTLSNSK